MAPTTYTHACRFRALNLVGALGIALVVSLSGGLSAGAHADTPGGPVVVDDGGMVLGPPPIAAGSDLMVRAGYQTAYTGDYERNSVQRVTTVATRPGRRTTGYFRVCNYAPAQRVTLSGTGSNAAFSVRYYRGGSEVTGGIISGTLRTRVLKDGECAEPIKIVVRRNLNTPDGKRRTFTMNGQVGSGEDDRASFRVLARPGGVPMRAGA